MSGECILAIDQGTTNTKALLVDHAGHTVFRTSTPLEILQPQPGFVEQDPLELWRSVLQVAAVCGRHAETIGTKIAGIAISNQRETALAWKRSAAGAKTAGEPVSNAISWQCRRSTTI